MSIPLFMSGRNHILILSLLFVLIHSLLFWHYGIREFFDSAAYLEAADYIITHGELQDVHHLFYTVPILIMTAIRLLFPGEIIPILLFQCFLSGKDPGYPVMYYTSDSFDPPGVRPDLSTASQLFLACTPLIGCKLRSRYIK